MAKNSSIKALVMTEKPTKDTPPNRLSVNPANEFFDGDILQRGIGIRFKGRVRTDMRILHLGLLGPRASWKNGGPKR